MIFLLNDIRTMNTITTSKQQRSSTQRGQWLEQQDYMGTAAHVAWERRQHEQARRRVLAHPTLSQLQCVRAWLQLEQQRVDALAVSRA